MKDDWIIRDNKSSWYILSFSPDREYLKLEVFKGVQCDLL